MISSDRAERLYAKMHQEMLCNLDSTEIEALTTVLTSSVVIKAFGRSLAYCQGVSNEMSQLDMSQKENQHKFTRGQGQVEGIKQMISGLLALVTEEEESDDDTA